VRDFASVLKKSPITAQIADEVLLRLEVDKTGLDALDRRYLKCLAENYAGGPVGVETLAAFLSEQRDMLEEVIEPYLMQKGLIQRTPRGRMLSSLGYEHLGLSRLTSE
jgi:Holliday junction DNA helicase RuvB